jgi:hypothetical protein
MTAFWDKAPCSLVEVDWHFRDAYYLHHQGNDCLDDGGRTHLHETTRCYIPQGCHLHTCQWENLKSHLFTTQQWITRKKTWRSPLHICTAHTLLVAPSTATLLHSNRRHNVMLLHIRWNMLAPLLTNFNVTTRRYIPEDFILATVRTWYLTLLNKSFNYMYLIKMVNETHFTIPYEK